ncbi:MAG: transglutaminase family protein [Spirochaetaceae bacterium]|jgi:transglutaminase-like putative cysteine protease|nr:transglutaminase family protein [Spirochaetaceae bacterium]
MSRAFYTYRWTVSFSRPVRGHSFLLRCTPAHNHFQHVESSSRAVFYNPQGERSTLFLAEDCFGNIVYSGLINQDHDYFEVRTEGEVELAPEYLIPDMYPNHVFLYETDLTQAGEAVLRLLDEAALDDRASEGEKALVLCEAAHRAVSYTPGETGTGTSAEEALRTGRGVCQDFAHILISLLRKKSISARYVTGFIEGEGATHAWVEYHDGAAWRALDPTHNRSVRSSYVKLSHGRDFADCSIERGIFTGAAGQTMEVSVKVKIS